MLAAALTLWVTFGLWIAAPALGASRAVARTAARLLGVELFAVLAWSYGCENGSCTVAASVAGVAARTDLPILTFIFLVVVAGRAWRQGATGTPPA
jgi:hypothetical protein